MRREPTFDEDAIVIVRETAEQSPEEVCPLHYAALAHHLTHVGLKVKFAHQVLAAHPQADKLLYARVDMIKHDETGEWCLSELELIEPYLHFRAHPEGADALASKLKQFVDRCLGLSS